ncbi:MAG: mammalian cell entry protein [Sphingobacteriia bacterium]|nr:mammalian cell entry protein [Sphingobacteriia bacterium]NCC39344.1 mammalian cell entry protein [Gammaproteobacteria bacterium]
MKDEPRPADRRLDRLYAPPEIGAPGRRRARAERRDLLYAGLFVIAMAALLVVILTLLLPGFLNQTYRLHAYFARADGLAIGMPVVQDGYVVGLLERLAPIFPASATDHRHCPEPVAQAPSRAPGQPCFRATLRIRDAWPIPADSLVQLGTLGLLRGDALWIHPGQAPERLSGGSMIAVSAPEPSLAEQLAMLTETVRLLVEDSIAPTLASIRDQVKTIELLIGAGEDQSDALGENRERLAGALENLRLLSERMVVAVDTEAIGDILASVQEMSASLARITAEMSGSTRDVQRAVTDYGELAVDIRALVNENRPAVQRSLDDAQIVLQMLTSALLPILTNIEDATRNLAALSSELRQDPTSLLRRRPQEDQSPWFQ